MSKKDADATPTPPTPQGPLGPWRLSISVLVALGFTGMPLWQTAQTGVGLDMALLRSFGVAFLTWIATGRLNRMLATDDTADDETAHETEPGNEPTGEHPVTQPSVG